ncbi:NLI interacting factor family phosphatase [Toxoplasma gondii VAND]|uniref:Mitochondrial import inner membrane translocase subunit TIM50 n=7 Tax=Toxoplasma gondii TaxID=5811 RepID=A0A7J6KA09_TOXGO|nr:NLI interacting factor family phosphatase [Toxoplasma gondii]KFH08102.1 NLI interacting factor family phosphatase [Toxoplasma gondii VAND]
MASTYVIRVSFPFSRAFSASGAPSLVASARQLPHTDSAASLSSSSFASAPSRLVSSLPLASSRSGCIFAASSLSSSRRAARWSQRGVWTLGASSAHLLSPSSSSSLSASSSPASSLLGGCMQATRCATSVASSPPSPASSSPSSPSSEGTQVPSESGPSEAEARGPVRSGSESRSPDDVAKQGGEKNSQRNESSEHGNEVDGSRTEGRFSAIFLSSLLLGGLIVEGGRVYERVVREKRTFSEAFFAEIRDLDSQMSKWNEQLHVYLDQKIGTGKKEAEPLLPDLAEINAPDLMPTLVLNFDNVLASIAYDPVKGYIVRKRPGVDAFLSTLANFYELVLWSDHPFPFIEDLLRARLEWPISFTLYQENMDRRGSSRYRNLERLGRRMDRVLYIDIDGSVLPSTQMRNFIKVTPFHGEAQEMLEDHALPELTDLLIGAAVSAGDVREMLLRYGGGADGNVGKRFLLEKIDAEKRANQRRSIGRVFGLSGAPGPQQRQKWEKA